MKLFRMTVLLAAVGATSPLLAQTSTANGDRHVGFGASISNVSGTVAPVFIVPIDVMPYLRIEPEIGYSRTSNEQTSQFQPPVPPPTLGPITTSTTSQQRVTSPSAGTGVFFVQSREKLKIEYGGRFGYTRTTTVFSTVTTTTTTEGTNTSTSQSLRKTSRL